MNFQEKYMNMKRISVLACLLLAFSLLLSACGGAGAPTDTHAATDATTDSVANDENPTDEIETEAPAAVDCTLTVSDQDGTALAALALTLSLANGSGDPIDLTTDSDGHCTVTLTEGLWRVSYEALPTGYLADVTSFLVNKENTAYDIKVINNIPNGTVERPFVIVDEITTVTIPAGASHVYVTYGAQDRSFVMSDVGLGVSYKDENRTANADGEIKFPLISQSPRDPAYITLTNTSNVDVEATFRIEADPGTLNNPYVVETIDEAFTANVPKESTVYYTWTATKSGILMVSSENSKNYIAMTNVTTYANSYYTEGTFCTYLAVSTGDAVQIAVASSDNTADVSEITFSLDIYEGTAEEPVLICKDKASFTLKGGESRVFSYTGTAVTMKVSGASLRVTYGDTTVEADANGMVEIAMDANSEAFVFTLSNVGEGNQEFMVQFLQQSAS